jgi:hypothetical protein
MSLAPPITPAKWHRWTIIAVLGLLPQACDVAAHDKKNTRHFEKQGGFSFVPPPGWTLRAFPGMKYKLAVGSLANGGNPNISFADEEFKGTLAEFVAQSKKAMKPLLQSANVVSETQLKTNEGAPVTRLIIEVELDGKKVRQNYFFWDFMPGKKLVATGSVLAESGALMDAVFRSAILSLRLEKP